MTPNPPAETPHRQSRRVQTVLLGAVVVLLAGILVVLIVNTAGDDATAPLDSSPSASRSSSLDEPLVTQEQTVYRFMVLTMVERDPAEAEKLMCGDFTGLTPDELLDDLTEWEETSNVQADVTVAFDDAAAGSRLAVEVRLETGASFQLWPFEVTVDPDGEGWAVCEVHRVDLG